MGLLAVAETKPWLLAAVTAAIALAAAVGAMVARRRAPAVATGLAGGLIAGAIGFLVGVVDGPRDTPQVVALWASGGLAVCGIAGLLVLRGRPPATRLLIAAGVVALLAPLVAGIVLLLLQVACPLYVGGRGYCSYGGIDFLGGWSAGVAILVGLDLLGIAFLLAVSGVQARDAPRS